MLSEFRARLIAGNAEQLLLDAMLTLFKQRGYLRARGKQRTDSTHVLAKIHALNRVLCVGETLRHTLNCLAIVAPEWLHDHSSAEWVERYEARMGDARTPLGEEARHAYAEVIGADGASLLSAIYEAPAPGFLREMPAVEIPEPASGCRTRCGPLARSAGALPRIFLRRPAISVRPTMSRPITAKSALRPGWVISVHLTETCDKDRPHFITHVETTSAPVSDDARTALIHEGLKRKDLLPEQHIVDTGYVDAKLLLERKPGLPDRSGGSHPAQSSMASQPAEGLRCRSLSHRLGPSTGDVPRGAHQQ